MLIDREQAFKDLKFIKEVMASSSRYTHLSGLGNIYAGVTVLVGCLVTYLLIQRQGGSFERALPAIGWQLLLVWGTVFWVATGLTVLCMVRKARRAGQSARSHLTRLILYAFSPPFLIGVALTIFLYWQAHYMWIAGVWMITYGLAVWSAGLFSIREPRWLAVVFMFCGLLTLFIGTQYSLQLVALTFGGFHIIYGLCLHLKYGG